MSGDERDATIVGNPHHTVTKIPVLVPTGIASPAPVVCLPSKPDLKDSLIQTGGSFLSKRCRLLGDVATVSCYIGKMAVLRGDIAKISIGQGVFVDENAIIRPPMRLGKVVADPVPVSVGNYVFIGPYSISEASSIGNFVIVEEKCVIGEKCVIHHGAWLKKGAVATPGQVLEPFGIYEGNPAKKVGRSQEDTHPIYVRELLSQLFQTLF